MLPVNPGGHAAYQNFVVTNLRKYYPNPNAFSRVTWDIIKRFWNLDLSYTDELLRSKYSVFGPKPRTPSCMQHSYLLFVNLSAPDVFFFMQVKRRYRTKQSDIFFSRLFYPVPSCIISYVTIK